MHSLRLFGRQTDICRVAQHCKSRGSIFQDGKMGREFEKIQAVLSHAEEKQLNDKAVKLGLLIFWTWPMMWRSMESKIKDTSRRLEEIWKNSSKLGLEKIPSSKRHFSGIKIKLPSSSFSSKEMFCILCNFFKE